MISIDHVFVFSSQEGKEAGSMVHAGFEESEGRYHTGQGTINRKFHFHNFFFEILWVLHLSELTSPKVKPSMLYQRAAHKTYGSSPFGLCLVNTPATDGLFQQVVRYQPAYFPEGMVIDVIPNTEYPSLPWIFRLPFRKNEQELITRKTSDIKHPNGANMLTKATFCVSSRDAQSPLIPLLSQCKELQFEEVKEPPYLLLTLDNENQQKKVEISDELPVSIAF